MSILKIHDNTFELLPTKGIFWHERNTLIVSDLHLGKVGHFRKNGLALTPSSGLSDLHRIDEMLKKHQPKRFLILGDLFHSDYNSDWEHFKALVHARPLVKFELVPGNHDILHHKHYTDANIFCHAETLTEGPFIFSHKPMEAEEGFLNFSGHIHPGVHISGLGKQSVKLPCFYLRNRTFLLPAFGKLTGLCLMPRGLDIEVYVIAGKIVQKF